MQITKPLMMKKICTPSGPYASQVEALGNNLFGEAPQDLATSPPRPP